MAFKMRYNKGNFPFKKTLERQTLERRTLRDDYGDQMDKKEAHFATQKAAKQDYYKKQIAAKQEHHDEQAGVEEPTKKKFKDTKLGEFLGVGKGDQRKHNRAARKTEGTRLGQWLRKKLN